jgi:hypothetical protein
MSLVFGVFDSTGSALNSCHDAVKEFALSSPVEQITDHKYCLLNGVRLWSSRQTVIQFDGIYAAFAGRCYNVKALSQKLKYTVEVLDEEHIVEVLVKGYLEYGFEFLKEIDGAFSLVVFQSKEMRLTLINDWYGFYPLFYSVGQSAIAFCSEYEPLLKLPFVDKSINKHAIADIVRYGLVTDSKTLLTGVQQLSPGSVLTFDENGTTIKTYVAEPHPEPGNITLQAATKQLSELISSAVKKRIVNYDKVTADLSGGIDTRLIVSSMTPELRSKVHFETMVTPPLTADTDRDVIIARQIAEHLGLKLNVGRYNFWDNDFGPEYYGNWRQGRYYHQHMKGLYGGEFLNGDALHFLSENYLSLVNGNRANPTTAFNGIPLNQILAKDFFDEVQSESIGTTQEIGQKLPARLSMMQVYSRSFFTNIYGGARSLWVQPFTFLTKVDTPFLDAQLINYLLLLPTEFLCGDKKHIIHESLFRFYFSNLNSIPTTSDMALFKDSCVSYSNKGVEAKNMRTIKTAAFSSKFAESKSAPIFDLFSYDYYLHTMQLPNPTFIDSILDLSAWLDYAEHMVANNFSKSEPLP